VARVSELLMSKGYEVLTVPPTLSIRKALTKMELISAGSAIVMDKAVVLGILSERDVIRKVILPEEDIDAMTVSEIMTTDLVTVFPESSLDECLSLFTEHRVRHLPVMKEGRLCGIVSIGDVVKFMIVEKDFKIKNLETYITGVL
jgi:CBS domain-containing protein